MTTSKKTGAVLPPAKSVILAKCAVTVVPILEPISTAAAFKSVNAPLFASETAAMFTATPLWAVAEQKHPKRHEKKRFDEAFSRILSVLFPLRFSNPSATNLSPSKKTTMPVTNNKTPFTLITASRYYTAEILLLYAYYAYFNDLIEG